MIDAHIPAYAILLKNINVSTRETIRDELMEIIPGQGTDVVKFGMSSENLEERLGTPETMIPYADIPDYPTGRVRWGYGKLDILFTRTHGVISITVDCAMEEVNLWGVNIAGWDVEALIKLVKHAKEKMEVGEPDPWGDFGIFLPSSWLDFAITDKELVSVEVQRPNWQVLGTGFS